MSELARVIGQSQPRVSQHLRQLCDAGLLERFRDGRRVFYRLPRPAGRSDRRAQLLALIPEEDGELQDDARRLLSRRASGPHTDAPQAMPEGDDRALHRALMDLTVTASLGDLLDVGCGRGRTLKLLAARANRAIGVDIDADARQFARAELLIAGLRNCSLRQGDMYRLPFPDGEFDTIILDGVLADARRPVAALLEAKRLLRDAGRLVVLEKVEGAAGVRQRSLAAWSVEAGLRLSPARLVPASEPAWLLSVATRVTDRSAAA